MRGRFGIKPIVFSERTLKNRAYLRGFPGNLWKTRRRTPGRRRRFRIEYYLMQGPATPMRWPAAWADPSMLRLVQGTAIDTLLVDNSDEFEGLRAAAEQRGLRVVHPDLPPDGVTLIKGEWPGVRLSRRGADAEAGPTGVPWVDSNGWAVRLAKALHPGNAVWVAAKPGSGAYLAAVADAAAYGGRWIVELEDAFAADLCEPKPRAQAAWKTVVDACAFFAAHREWDAWEPVAIVGVISDFSGENEFFAGELLNLLARAGVHFVVWPKDRVPEIRGVRAVIYADRQPPPPELQARLRAFPGIRITGADGDPYQVAQDAAVKISHRYDLVRFWNAGAVGSYVAKSPDGKRAVAHLLFYADRGPNDASVRVAGKWREVKASTVSGPVRVEVVRQADAIEVHLPPVEQYVALELTV
jgi:hypothetical protein